MIGLILAAIGLSFVVGITMSSICKAAGALDRIASALEKSELRKERAGCR